jgi:retron-type reverse transcriptase
MTKKVNWVLDLDIREFFTSINHEWRVKFVEHRIADRRIVRLIQKWLRAGVLEDGERTQSEVGTPQGGGISPYPSIYPSVRRAKRSVSFAVSRPDSLRRETLDDFPRGA